MTDGDGTVDEFMDGAEANRYVLPGAEHFRNQYHRDSWVLQRECLRRGLRTTRLSGILFSVFDRGTSMGFRWTAGSSNSPVVRHLTHDKQTARILMQKSHIPVPEGSSFPIASDLATMDQYAESIGYPVVVKPRDGTGGRGVTVGIDSRNGLERAVNVVGRLGFREAIIEKHALGAAHRIFATRTEAISVAVKRPANIVGDGESSVRELAERMNSERRNAYRVSTSVRSLGPDTSETLASQGYTLESVPALGDRVYLSRVDSLSQGAQGAEVYDFTHPEILEMAARSVASVPGLEYAGVDVILEDSTLGIGEQSVAVCELNANPSLRNHEFPLYGRPRSVAGRIVDIEAEINGVYPNRNVSDAALAMIVQNDRGAAYAEWITQRSREIGADLEINSRKNSFEAVVSGSMDAVSILAAQAIYGPDGCRVSYVDGQVVS